jgi:hypothetical protein
MKTFEEFKFFKDKKRNVVYKEVDPYGEENWYDDNVNGDFNNTLDNTDIKVYKKDIIMNDKHIDKTYLIKTGFKKYNVIGYHRVDRGFTFSTDMHFLNEKDFLKYKSKFLLNVSNITNEERQEIKDVFAAYPYRLWGGGEDEEREYMTKKIFTVNLRILSDLGNKNIL